MVVAIERFAAANAVELTRADAKAAVLLAFTGAVMGIAVSGVTKGPQAAAGAGGVLWWSGVACGLLAVGCFVRAIAPPATACAGPVPCGRRPPATSSTSRGR